MNTEALLYGVVIPTALFGLETLALAIWVKVTAEPPTKQNKSITKGKTNGR